MTTTRTYLNLSCISCYGYQRALHSFPTRRSSDLRRGAALEIRDLGALLADDQGALELAGVGGVDAEVGGELHGARSEEHTSDSHVRISYAVFCLKKKKNRHDR